MRKRKIAIVVLDLVAVGGVEVVAKYLHRIINDSADFTAEIISTSTSVVDENSVRLLRPKTWTKGIQVTNRRAGDIDYRHVGAHFTEIEYFRYRPRKVLDTVLNEFDLVQVVSGPPPNFFAVKNFRGKTALQVATTTKSERETVLREAPQPRRAWMKFSSKLNEPLERYAFQRADAIFVENFWLKEHLQKSFPEKTVFAPPGVDTNFFLPKEGKKGDYVLSVGRFVDRRKNIRLLFEAYSLMRQKYADTPRLVLAGHNAPTKEDLAVAERLKVDGYIDILTGLTLEQLRDVYQNAAFFMMSSNEEGFGLVVTEAMACGLPVVSTRCGGPEVQVDDNANGFLVEKHNAEALAEKAVELLKDPQKRLQFGVNARKKVETHFSLEATGKVFLDVYRRLLQ